MLQLPVKQVTAIPLILGLMIVSLSISASAKCADALIHVYGSLVGDPPADLTVTLETCPKSRRATPTVPVTRDGFDLTTNFETYLFEDRKVEHCLRVPETVFVIFLRNNEEVKRVSLELGKDFVRDAHMRYNLREPLKIRFTD